MKPSAQNTIEQFEDYEVKVKTYSQTELVNSATDLFMKEKKIGDAIIVILSEIQQRRIYAVLGFASLFEMLTKHFKLSESAAYQRVSLIKLIRDVPAAKNALVIGEASMSNLVLVNSYIKEQEKNSNKMTEEAKRNIIEIVKDKSYKEAKEQLVLLSPQLALPKDKIKPINETQVNLQCTIDKVLQQKLDKIKNLISNKTPSPTINELLHIMADLTIEQIEKKKGIAKKVQTYRKVCVTKSALKNCKSKSKSRSRYIPKNVRREVFERAEGQCQYISEAGLRCCSKKFLQFEHSLPFAKGGMNNVETLLILCREHNFLRAKQEFGIDPREYKRTGVKLQI